MGRLAQKALSARQIETEVRLGYHADGPHTGLYLQVAKGQHGVTRSWIYRYTSPTLRKRREMGLGPAGLRKLAEARALAATYRLMVLNGQDPKDERDRERESRALARARQLTFDEAVTECLKTKEPEWKNAKHAQQWRSTLATYASPAIGDIPVDAISTVQIHKLLKPIWLEKTETASRLRQRIEVVLDWAKAGGYRSGDNPASLKGALGELLPKAGKVKKVVHHAALPYARINEFITALRAIKGTGSLAFELMILTATRTNEVIAARWEEIDLTAKVWTIPATRMKGGREHVAPLCSRAIEIVETMRRAGSETFVFPGYGIKSDKHLSSGAFLAIMKRLPAFSGFTPHGMRSCFRDWAGETTEFPREVIEHALAHQLPDKAEAAYARGTLLQKRAALMTKWQQYIETVRHGATIATIRSALR